MLKDWRTDDNEDVFPPCGGKCGGCHKSEDDKDVCEEQPCYEDELCDKNCDGCEKGNTKETD